MRNSKFYLVSIIMFLSLLILFVPSISGNEPDLNNVDDEIVANESESIEEEKSVVNMVGDITALSESPINPAYEEYLKQKNSGQLKTVTEDGMRLGYIPHPFLTRVDGSNERDRVYSVGQPASFDLRTTDRITAVRNQNQFGSCWAFATYASLESYLKNTQTRDFSENNLMWLHGLDWGPDDGGNEFMSAAYLSRWSGPINESQDPYNGVKPGTPGIPGLDPAYHVQRVEFIPADAYTVKSKLQAGGALYTSFMHDNANYNSTHKSYYYSGSNPINHAVAIVGWDDNYSRFNFNTTAPSNGAWILKNSWGTGWGDSGYFYMSYYDTHAIANVTAFHNAESVSNYNRIYQYDPLGWVSRIGYGSTTAWAANIFTAAASENLAAVSTYFASPGSTYEVRIYSNVSAGAPTSGMLAHTQSGSVTFACYHTISLSSPVPVTAGQRFSVVIKYTTPGYNYPVPVEDAMVGYSSEATANPGESFISSAGATWQDMTSRYSTMNACIKAFTSTTGSNYTLTVRSTNPASGVNIISSSGHGGKTLYRRTIAQGTRITLTAPLHVGSGANRKTFTRWSGASTSTDRTITLRMKGNRAVTANYRNNPVTTNCTLTVKSTNPASGVNIISSSGHGGRTLYRCTIAQGTRVTLTAPLHVGSGANRKTFTRWSGASTSTDRTITLRMNGNRAVTANYRNNPR